MPVRECRVACNRDDVICTAAEVAGDSHAESGRERRACVSRTVGVMFAFGAEHESIEAAGLTNSVEPVAAAGEQLMDVSLVAYVHGDLVFGSIESDVESDGELDYSQIGAEMAPGAREGLDQEIADFGG